MKTWIILATVFHISLSQQTPQLPSILNEFKNIPVVSSFLNGDLSIDPRNERDGNEFDFDIRNIFDEINSHHHEKEKEKLTMNMSQIETFIFSQMYKNLAKYYLPVTLTVNDSSEACVDTMQQLNTTMYSPVLPDNLTHMIDSWGKPSDGLMNGAYNLPGFMDECLQVEGMRYCFITLSGVSKLTPTISYGSCMPNVCSDMDLKESLVESKAFPYPVTVQCYDQQYPTDWGAWEIGGTTVIAAFGLLVIIATLVDMYSDKISKPLQAFSAAANAKKIMAVRLEGAKGEITCFHAIRVFSIGWVVLGHQFAFTTPYADNGAHVIELTKMPGLQVIWSGLRAVDTFFFLGGLLIGRGLMSKDFCIRRSEEDKESSTSDHIVRRNKLRMQGAFTTIKTFLSSYALYVFSRIVRLWPAMFLTIMFFAGPSKFFVSGPHQSTWTDVYLKSCREYYYEDLSLFTNFFMYSQAINKYGGASCLGQTWYIAVDFQIFLVMPFLLLPIKLMKNKQWYLWLLILASCMIAGAVTLIKDLPAATLLSITDPSESTRYFAEWYVMPYTRAVPYLCGALCGYWLYQFEKSPESGKEMLANFYEKHPLVAKMYPRVVGWGVAAALGWSTVFDMMDYNYIGSPHTISRAGAFLYSAFQIFAWSVALGWVVMNCATGLAGPLNFFLSHPMWQPLSRLSFGVYLISLPLQYLILSQLQVYIYVTYNFLIMIWASVMILCFFAAFALSILAEAPIIALLKLIK